MNNRKQRNLGEQPITKVMEKHNLKPHDIVIAATEQITHKMITRAAKGRKLTAHVKLKILNALNNSTKRDYKILDLFNY